MARTWRESSRGANVVFALLRSARLAPLLAVRFPSDELVVFKLVWSICAGDPDIVKWCESKRAYGAGPDVAAAALRQFLHMAESESTPRHSLLVVAGNPHFVVEHETGRIFSRVRAPTQSEYCVKPATRPAMLLPAAQRLLVAAIKTGKSPIEDDLMPEPAGGSGPLSALVALRP